MTPLPDVVLTVFLIFCRIGGCLMLVPGYSSHDIPMRVRLIIALAVTLVFVPLLQPEVGPLVRDAQLRTLVTLVVSELTVGAVIGLAGRMLLLALETLATAAAMSIGLTTMAGMPTDEQEQIPSLASLIVVAATALFFFTDQHWEVLRGLSASYKVWRPQDGLDAGNALAQITDRLSDAFTLTLRVCSPFIIYGVVVNFAIGLANKLTPSIPVYFIAMPFVLIGGLFLLQFTIVELLEQFTAALAAWVGG
jgi:flagellar biosynthesis protein FliR